MKWNRLFHILALGAVTAMTVTTVFPSAAYAAETAVSEDDSALQSLFEDAGFSVSEGTFYELDTVKEASAGNLLSCFGNNSGSAYTVFNMPDAPNQEVANPAFPPGGWEYKLCQDEAIVLITNLPPECKYYSYINYIMFTEEKEGKDYSGTKGYKAFRRTIREK